MTQLHEILAVDADRQSAAQAILEEGANTFAKKPHLFTGHVKDTEFFSETRQGENTHEESRLSETVQGKLDYVAGIVGAHWDTLLTKEAANQTASADLIVDGQVLARSLPATFLLGMETRLKALRQMYLQIPTLDPGKTWTPDEAQGAGVFRSVPERQMKTEKTLQHKVLVAPTDKHPAQVEKWTEDQAVAAISVTRFSGMVSPARKSEMLARIGALLSAVKQARQRANTVEVTQARVAQDLFGYIHRE